MTTTKNIPLQHPFDSCVEKTGEGASAKPKRIKSVTIRRSTAGDNLRVAEDFHPGIDSDMKGNLLLIREVCDLDPKDFDQLDSDDLDTLQIKFQEVMGKKGSTEPEDPN